MNLKIGNLKLDNNIIAAPMAGFTDHSWRVIARKLGAGLVFSEMISVEGLLRRHKKTETYLKNAEDARPFAVQLFGSTPESFVKAIDVVKEYEFDLVDINAGCPVKKVVSKGSGSALMKDPKKIEVIIGSVRKIYDGPLTIKIRSGWDSESINAVEVAKLAQGAGVDAVIVHPRTKDQGFSGSADWSVIADVKKAISIPVIGNGDAVDKESAQKMFEQTGCDGIMVGRAALGNPFIFDEINSSKQHSMRDTIQIINEHIKYLKEEMNEFYTVMLIRKFIPKYLKGVPNHIEINRKIFSLKTIDEILDCVNSFEYR
ncbi:tRNA dihydrouridine synthase DusB [bacterium]|nr:tRNA dihydrouridine synthase DusB [bacterium]